MKLNKFLISLVFAVLPFSTSFAAGSPELNDITMDVVHGDSPTDLTHEIELPEQASPVAAAHVEDHDKNDSMDDGAKDAAEESKSDSHESVTESVQDSVQESVESATSASEESKQEAQSATQDN